VHHYGLNYNNNITFIQRLNNRDNMATYYVARRHMPLYVANPDLQQPDRRPP
jgi:hypothetical protein